MYSKFPFSLERLPRPRGCACVSLRAGCVLTGILTILYSVLLLSMGLASVLDHPPHGWEGWTLLLAALATHSATLVLSALLLVGALREKPWMIRPWVVFKALHLAAAALVFIVGTALRVADVDYSTLPLVCAEFFSILIWSYLLVVVVSYVRELEDFGAETVRLRKLDDTWYTTL